MHDVEVSKIKDSYSTSIAELHATHRRDMAELKTKLTNQFKVIYYTVVCGDVLYCTVLYCTVLYCTVLYCTVLYCTVLVMDVLTDICCVAIVCSTPF